MMGVFESWYQIQGQRGMKWEHWALGAAIVSSFVCTLLLIVNIVHVYGDRASSSPPIASRRGTGSVGSSRFAEGLRLPARTPLRSTAECRRKWPELVQSDCEKVKRTYRKEEERRGGRNTNDVQRSASSLFASLLPLEIYFQVLWHSHSHKRPSSKALTGATLSGCPSISLASCRSSSLTSLPSHVCPTVSSVPESTRPAIRPPIMVADYSTQQAVSCSG